MPIEFDFILHHMMTNIAYECGQYNHIYRTPTLGQDMKQGQFLKRSLAGLKSEFSFS